ncbi:AraC family transcriptional regulator [Mycobacterium sp. M1]|uniref:AraC family transcriptional regulator n=1 Tax=Mycolicibacter acidiphilus TaxID=2835306 RepID=A0ABS5RQ17_9MYCO|nr:AraC family transcriptional regulator [Mycolicibacter acidiphilus]MBS9536112.1 AraC family transcriptional regulator [Mycolicibacter acidiphilus]
MPDFDLPRPPASALVLTTLGLEHDVGADVALRGTGLAFAALSDPQTPVSGRQEMRIAQNLLAELGDATGLGVEAGMRYHLTTHGIWGFALASCPTVRSAIEVGLRYVDLTFAFTRMSLITDDDGVRLLLDPSDLPVGVRRFFVERETASIAHLGRQVTSNVAPLGRAHFAFPEPESLEPYRVFDPLPIFGTDANLIEVPREILDLPIPQADPYAAAITQQQCRELLDQRRARTGYAGQVRDRLLQQPGRLPDLEAVAGDLHMSSRTLRRHLEREGTSYRGLVDEVRERLAEELLGIGALSVADIGRRLGYADTPSFTAAFKRWKGGVSPRAYTRQAQPSAPQSPSAVR